MRAQAETPADREKAAFWLGLSALFLGVTGPFAIYLGVKAWQQGIRSMRIALSIGMGVIGCLGLLGAAAGAIVPGSANTGARATGRVSEAKPAAPTDPQPGPPAQPRAAPAGDPKQEPEPVRAETTSASAKPLAWQAPPEATLVEMEDRLEILTSIYAEAARLPGIMRKQGPAEGGKAMRSVQAKCKAASGDYELRFGSLIPWSGYELHSKYGRAHTSMRGVIAHVCGVCATLLPGASDACKRAREPVAEAKKSLAAWRATMKGSRLLPPPPRW